MVRTGGDHSQSNVYLAALAPPPQEMALRSFTGFPLNGLPGMVAFGPVLGPFEVM